MTKKTSDIASNLSKITKYMMIQDSEPHNPIPCTTDQANWHIPVLTPIPHPERSMFQITLSTPKINYLN